MTAVDTTSKFVEVLSRGTVLCRNQNQFSFFIVFFCCRLTIIYAVMKCDDNIELNFLQSANNSFQYIVISCLDKIS